MFSIPNKLYLLGLIVTFLSCVETTSPDDDMVVQEETPPTEEQTPTLPIIKSYPNVDENLWKYFEAFELAAQERGFSYDLIALQVEGNFLDLGDNSIAGQCTYNSHAPELVTIDTDFWEWSDEWDREMVIFHELGHCVLNRDHNENHINGVCTSIMRSGVSGCRDNYNENTRVDYLDELFKKIST